MPTVDVPIPFDVLISASVPALGRYCNAEIGKQLSGSMMTFRLTQSEIGNLGNVVISKLGDRFSKIDFENAPKPTDEEGIAYTLKHEGDKFSPEWLGVLKSCLDQLKAQKRQTAGTIDLFDNLRRNDNAKWRAKMGEFRTQLNRACELLREKRKEYLIDLMKAYFETLSREPIWLARPEWLPNARLVATLDTPGAPVSAQSSNEPPTKPTANQVDEEQNATRRTTTKRRSARLIDMVLIVLGVLIALAINVASSTLPKEWEPHLWLSWPLLGVLVMFSIVLVHRQSGTSETHGA